LCVRATGVGPSIWSQIWLMQEQTLQLVGFLEKLICFTLKPFGSLSQKDARFLLSTDIPQTKQ
jgi:hypothetical protein